MLHGLTGQVLSGPLGPAFLFAAMVVQVIIPPLPAEAIVIAAGQAQGIWITALITGSGLWAGSVIVYYAGRFLRRRFDRFFSGKLLSRVIGRLHAHERALLWLRIMPYNPSDIISYAAGIIGTDWRRYFLVTAATSFGRAALLAWLGHRITGWGGVLAAAGVLLMSGLAAHWVLKRRT